MGGVRFVCPMSLVSHTRVQDGDARYVSLAPIAPTVNAKDGVYVRQCPLTLPQLWRDVVDATVDAYAPNMGVVRVHVYRL